MYFRPSNTAVVLNGPHNRKPDLSVLPSTYPIRGDAQAREERLAKTKYERGFLRAFADGTSSRSDLVFSSTAL